MAEELETRPVGQTVEQFKTSLGGATAELPGSEDSLVSNVIQGATSEVTSSGAVDVVRSKIRVRRNPRATINPLLIKMARLHVMTRKKLIATSLRTEGDMSSIQFDSWIIPIEERRDSWKKLMGAGIMYLPDVLLTRLGNRLTDTDPRKQMDAWMEIAAIESMPGGKVVVEGIIGKSKLKDSPALWEFRKRAEAVRLSSNSDEAKEAYMQKGQEIYAYTTVTGRYVRASRETIKASYEEAGHDSIGAKSFVDYIDKQFTRQVKNSPLEIGSGTWDDILAYITQTYHSFAKGAYEAQGGAVGERITVGGIEMPGWTWPAQLLLGTLGAAITAPFTEREYPHNVELHLSDTSPIVTAMWQERFEWFAVARQRIPDADEVDVVSLANSMNLANKMHKYMPFYDLDKNTNTVRVTLRESPIPITVEMYDQVRRQAVIPWLMYKNGVDRSNMKALEMEARFYHPVWTNEAYGKDGERGGFRVKNGRGETIPMPDPDDPSKYSSNPLIWVPDLDDESKEKIEIFKETRSEMEKIRDAQMDFRGKTPLERRLPLKGFWRTIQTQRKLMAPIMGPVGVNAFYYRSLSALIDGESKE